MNPAAAPMPLRQEGLLIKVGDVEPLAEAVVRQLLAQVSRQLPQLRWACRSLHSEQGQALAELDAQAGQAPHPEWGLAGKLHPPHAVWVLASPDVQASAALLEQLRQCCAGASQVLAVDAGAALLAEAGVWRQGRAVVNWALLDAMLEDHPGLVWSDRLWDGEGRQWSCGGGLAVVELMLAWLTQTHPEAGEALQSALLEHLGLEQPRPRDTRQRRPLSERLGGGSPKLSEALALMEANLAEPLATEEIARLVGVSRRQLERLFRQHLDALPSRHYAELRLQRARRLLQQSAQSILQIGLSCGFASGPHFSNAYKAFFGHTPRDERSQRAASLRRGPQAIAQAQASLPQPFHPDWTAGSSPPVS